jgi:dienelactone hydrolase
MEDFRMFRFNRALRFAAVVAACCSSVLSAGVAKAAGTFTSGGDKYAIERFPDKPDTTMRKVVVLVHGTDGLANFGGQLRAFAKVLAGKGYLAVLPNYFGTVDTAPKSGTPDEEVQRLSDAIDWATGQPDAVKGRIGLVGYSLGSALSLRYAEINPMKITALVDNYGPTDQTDPRMMGTLSDKWRIVDDAAKLPPTLVLHNKKDEIVVMNRHSVPLVAALRKAMIRCDFKDYDDGDPKLFFHPFLAGGKEDMDSQDKTVDWLDKNL